MRFQEFDKEAYADVPRVCTLYKL